VLPVISVTEEPSVNGPLKSLTRTLTVPLAATVTERSANVNVQAVAAKVPVKEPAASSRLLLVKVVTTPGLGDELLLVKVDAACSVFRNISELVPVADFPTVQPVDIVAAVWSDSRRDREPPSTEVESR